MNTEELIKKLKESNLYAECLCGGEFKLAQAVLFDGTKPFPREALEAQKKFEELLKEKKEELKESKKSVERSGRSAKFTNIGLKLQTIVPLMKDFKWDMGDCRFLGDPLDVISFNGFSMNRVQSLSFIDVKTGVSSLKPHQKAIKEAIEDKKVSYKVLK